MSDDDRVLLLLVIVGLVLAAAVITMSAGREPIPTDPGVPSTVTTIGGRP